MNYSFNLDILKSFFAQAPWRLGWVSSEKAAVSLFTFVDAIITALLLLIKNETPKAFYIFPEENIEAQSRI